jgi:hypothetical protein
LKHHETVQWVELPASTERPDPSIHLMEGTHGRTAAARGRRHIESEHERPAGGGTLQDLTNGLGAWALVAALAGLFIGAAAWALGVHAQNYQQSMVGRRAVLVSGLAALLIGAAPPIINFFFHAGTNLH